MNKILSYFLKTPKKIFLIDSLGAMMSSFGMFMICNFFQSHIGLSGDILFALALVGVMYSLYSMGCYLLLNSPSRPFILAIAFANGLYVITIMSLTYTHFHSITTLGLAYMVVESSLITLIAIVEYQIALHMHRNLHNKSKQIHN